MYFMMSSLVAVSIAIEVKSYQTTGLILRQNYESIFAFNAIFFAASFVALASVCNYKQEGEFKPPLRQITTTFGIFLVCFGLIGLVKIVDDESKLYGEKYTTLHY